MLLGLAAFLVALVALFPAAPIVDRIRPQLGPVALEGVSGRAFAGRVARARSTDDLLPLEFSDVTWRLAPTALPGGGGARVGFTGYGGEGEGLVRRRWGGDLVVEDFRMSARAKALEPLLPAPIAEFDGAIDVEIDELAIVDGLLDALRRPLRWSDAVLERPAAVRFGDVGDHRGPGRRGPALGHDRGERRGRRRQRHLHARAERRLHARPARDAGGLRARRGAGRASPRRAGRRAGALPDPQSGNVNRLM